MDKIIIEPVKLIGQRMLLLRFSYNRKYIEMIRGLDGAIWNTELSGWLIKNHRANFKEVFRIFRGVAFIDAQAVFEKPEKEKDKAIHTRNSQKVTDRSARDVISLPDAQVVDEIKRFGNLMRQQRYSENSIRTYTQGLTVFFGFFKGRTVRDLTKIDFQRFNDEYIIPSYAIGGMVHAELFALLGVIPT